MKTIYVKIQHDKIRTSISLIGSMRLLYRTIKSIQIVADPPMHEEKVRPLLEEAKAEYRDYLLNGKGSPFEVRRAMLALHWLQNKFHQAETERMRQEFLGGGR